MSGPLQFVVMAILNAVRLHVGSLAYVGTTLCNNSSYVVPQK